VNSCHFEPALPQASEILKEFLSRTVHSFLLIVQKKRNKEKDTFPKEFFNAVKTTPKTMRCYATEIHRFSPHSDGKECQRFKICGS